MIEEPTATGSRPAAGAAPSPWVERWSSLVRPGGSVLDVACGAGRHVRWFAERGHRVTGVDRDAEALRPLESIAEILVADIERDAWPLEGRRFDAVIVTRYLWRARFPDIVRSVGQDGGLIYETYSAGNETVGRPANPEFLLRPGELLEVARGLRVVAFEDGFLEEPPRFVQRIAAVRESPGHAVPVRHPL